MNGKREFTVGLFRIDKEGCNATLELPATWSEYRDALEKARLTDDYHTPYKIEILSVRRELLRPHLEDAVMNNRTFLEMNLLAQKLSELDVNQADSFEALLKADMDYPSPEPGEGIKIIPLQRMINYTFNLEKFPTAPNVHTDEALGRFLYENDMLPDDQHESARIRSESGDYADEYFQLIGKIHRKENHGVFTSGGYHEIDGNIEEVYVPGEIAYFDRSGAPVVLEVSKRFFNDSQYDNGLTAKLDLPVTDVQFNKAIEAVEAASWNECNYGCIECLIPAAGDWINDTEDFELVKRFACFLEQLQRKESPEKYKALLEATNCCDLETAVRLGDDLNEYTLDTEITSPTDYAKQSMLETYGIKDTEPFMSYIQLHRYGIDTMENDNAVFTSYGILCRSDGGPIQVPQSGMSGMGGM